MSSISVVVDDKQSNLVGWTLYNKHQEVACIIDVDARLANCAQSIEKEIANLFSVNHLKIRSRSADREYTLYRHMVWAILRDLGVTLKKVGRIYGVSDVAVRNGVDCLHGKLRTVNYSQEARDFKRIREKFVEAA